MEKFEIEPQKSTEDFPFLGKRSKYYLKNAEITNLHLKNNCITKSGEDITGLSIEHGFIKNATIKKFVSYKHKNAALSPSGKPLGVEFSDVDLEDVCLKQIKWANNSDIRPDIYLDSLHLKKLTIRNIDVETGRIVARGEDGQPLRIKWSLWALLIGILFVTTYVLAFFAISINPSYREARNGEVGMFFQSEFNQIGYICSFVLLLALNNCTKYLIRQFAFSPPPYKGWTGLAMSQISWCFSMLVIVLWALVLIPHNLQGGEKVICALGVSIISFFLPTVMFLIGKLTTNCIVHPEKPNHYKWCILVILSLTLVSISIGILMWIDKVSDLSPSQTIYHLNSMINDTEIGNRPIIPTRNPLIYASE
ncbi:hypothetical protein NECID01_1475 [Nematocida sp. AWRm77]|nr:hypothetical protein NECID01_1475 [Nematocida sp. AWRm77]